jgi:hypothetical protein
MFPQAYWCISLPSAGIHYSFPPVQKCVTVLSLHTVAFWVMTPPNLVGGYQHFAAMHCLCIQVEVTTMKIKAICYFKMLVPTHQTIWCQFTLLMVYLLMLSVALLTQHRMVWWLMNRKGCGRMWSISNLGNILEFAWRAWGKQWKTSVRIVSIMRFETSSFQVQVKALPLKPTAW